MSASTSVSNAAPAAPSNPNPQQRAFNLGEVTGLPAFKNLNVPGYDRPWNTAALKTPPRNDNYVWDEDLVRTMLLLQMTGVKRAMKLIGPTGAGKTAGVLQWHAMLNLPLMVVCANPRTEAQQLMGSVMLTEQGMRWVDGPLLIAARRGISILIDEYNLIDPGEANGLNAFLEGVSYTIAETGETVVPHPSFRVYATMNAKQAGYRGRQVQDIANDGRFLDVQVKYLDPAVEVDLVTSTIVESAKLIRKNIDPALAKTEAQTLVRFANKVREMFMGVSNKADALPCTMCTRTLLAWAKLSTTSIAVLDAGTVPTHWALSRVLTDRQEPEVREALHRLLSIETGR